MYYLSQASVFYVKKVFYWIIRHHSKYLLYCLQYIGMGNLRHETYEETHDLPDILGLNQFINDK